MTAYYNEIDPYAAQWLRNLIDAGLIADGVVDERSIKDVEASDLEGFDQCHFFAGIGVWSLALRQAGWKDDRPVWTGSCPCQPFSAAGNRGGSPTSATCGQTGSNSLKSADLQQFLANRLRAKAALLGSTLYKLTWKERITPSGWSIPALRASVLRTGGKDYTGWPTPTVGNSMGSQMPKNASATGRRANGTKATVALNPVAQLAGWPTPTTRDHKDGGHSRQGILRLQALWVEPQQGWKKGCVQRPSTKVSQML